MDSVSVPLRSSGKKMRKRRELDALVAHSLAKRYLILCFSSDSSVNQKYSNEYLCDFCYINQFINRNNSTFLRRACNSGKRQAAGNGIHSQDQLLSQSTDDQEEYSLVPFPR